jgi:Na+/phosphate symporter
MKEKSIFFNPLRMISPKFNVAVSRMEELYATPVSDALTLQEGLLVMASKLIEMSKLLRSSFLQESAAAMESFEKLAQDVHEQEKFLTGNLACSLTEPRDICKTFILFPGHLERVGDYMESMLNCCKTKAREGYQVSENAIFEINEFFKLMAAMMNNFRDSLVIPNKMLLKHVVSESEQLDRKAQEWQLLHIERLLEGTTAPKASSLYLDILDSTQGVTRHFRQMAEALLALVVLEEQEEGE